MRRLWLQFANWITNNAQIFKFFSKQGSMREVYEHPRQRFDRRGGLLISSNSFPCLDVLWHARRNNISCPVVCAISLQSGHSPRKTQLGQMQFVCLFFIRSCGICVKRNMFLGLASNAPFQRWPREILKWSKIIKKYKFCKFANSVLLEIMQKSKHGSLQLILSFRVTVPHIVDKFNLVMQEGIKSSDSAFYTQAAAKNFSNL